jgi:hypothetical protein
MSYLAKDVFFALAEELLDLQGKENGKPLADDLLDNLPLDLRNEVYDDLGAEGSEFLDVHEAAAIVAGAHACLPGYKPGRRLHSQRRTVKRYAMRQGWPVLDVWEPPSIQAMFPECGLKITPDSVGGIVDETVHHFKAGNRVRVVVDVPSYGAWAWEDGRVYVKEPRGCCGTVQFVSGLDVGVTLDGHADSQIVRHTDIALLA